MSNFAESWESEPPVVLDDDIASSEAPSTIDFLPQHDLDAEAAVLSAVMIDGARLDEIAPLLRPDHFYSEAHRRTFEACICLRAAGSQVDLVTVCGWLRDHDRLRQVGGASYLTNLLNAAPAIANVADYARLVREKARLRAIGETSRAVMAQAYVASDPGPLLERAISALEGLRGSSPARTLAARVRSLGRAPARLVTGFATLDHATRGGIPLRKLAVLGGAPGTGKTTLSADLAYRSAVAGVFVSLLAADEDADAVAIRFGQLAGFTREELELGDVDARELLAERLERLPISLVDADEDGASVEDVSTQLRRARGDRPSLLIIDSIQTVRALGSAEADGPRARVDAIMAALKRCAKVDGHAVIATCELARGAYRSRSTLEQIDDLAAFKESGGIEYGAGLLLVMRNVAGRNGIVDVAMPKNRFGEKRPFRLSLDPRHARFSEVALDDPREDEQRREAADGARIEQEVGAVERYLVEHPGVHGIGALRAGLRAAGLLHVSNDRIDVAVARLGDRIENRPEKGHPRWFLRSSSQGGT